MSHKEMSIRFYYSFAYPYLIYCVEIWGHAGDRLLNPLFLVPKKIVRIIAVSAFLAHTAPIFLKLRLLPLCNIVLQRTNVFMYKLMNNMLPIAMNSLVVRNNDIHHYITPDRIIMCVDHVQNVKQL